LSVDKYNKSFKEMLSALVLKNRSYRRFDSSVAVPSATLVNLVDLARLCPSSRNQQALKFMLFNRKELCDKIFTGLAWAGYLKEWPGPSQEERPAAYIVILGDKTLGSSFSTDLGITAQTMMLGAVEAGYGGCMIGSFKREYLDQLLGISDQMEILLVLAVGKPVEEVAIEPVKDNDIRYWRDSRQVHHVPKRSVEELIPHSDLLTE
jgi:nitroreductase